MELTNAIALASAVGAILGILIPAVISLVQARVSAASDMRRIGIDKERQEADQINAAANISLQASTMMQQALLSSMDNLRRLETEKRQLEDENSSLRLGINRMQIAIHTAIADIRTLIEDHAEHSRSECEFFAALQDRLQRLLQDLTEVMNANP